MQQLVREELLRGPLAVLPPTPVLQVKNTFIEADGLDGKLCDKVPRSVSCPAQLGHGGREPTDDPDDARDGDTDLGGTEGAAQLPVPHAVRDAAGATSCGSRVDVAAGASTGTSPLEGAPGSQAAEDLQRRTGAGRRRARRASAARGRRMSCGPMLHGGTPQGVRHSPRRCGSRSPSFTALPPPPRLGSRSPADAPAALPPSPADGRPTRAARERSGTRAPRSDASDSASNGRRHRGIAAAVDSGVTSAATGGADALSTARRKKLSKAEAEVVEFNRALVGLSLRLSEAARAGDAQAAQWAALVRQSADARTHRSQRERLLQVLYGSLYGRPPREAFPPCPLRAVTVREAAEADIASCVNGLHVSLDQVLSHAADQSHPGVYLLLSCHLGKISRRHPVWFDFPWVLVATCLLALGLFLGRSSESPQAV